VEVFDGVTGVVSATAEGGIVHLVVDGSVDAALKAASRLTVMRIVTLDTDLEDVFLTYYRDDEP
jgi:ABC-2 type transport system ATP-binding protein